MDYKIDRNKVDDDERNRILDLSENSFTPPETGIYEGALRYYAASIEWAKFIEGFLSWSASIAVWPDASDESYHAIQQILIFLQGVEPMSIDYDLMADAIARGNYKAWNDLAKQVVSGRTTNINVDGEGVVTDPNDIISEDDAPSDDPATPDIDERKASIYAGYLSMALDINDLLAYLHTLYGPTTTAVTSADDAKLLIDSRYATVSTIYDAIDAYWAARAAGNSQIITADREDLANYLYCNRFGDNIRETIKGFFANLSGPTNAQKLNAIGIVGGMGDEQYSIWYNQGAATRTTEYKSAPCEPIDDYEFTLQFNTTFNDTHVFKAYHRYECTIIGYGVDPIDGDWQDAFWHKQTGQNPVFDNADFSIQIGQAVKRSPDVFEAPINATMHAYKWSIDMGPINASPQWTMNRDATMSVGTTSPSNGFLVTVKDLGQYR